MSRKIVLSVVLLLAAGLFAENRLEEHGLKIPVGTVRNLYAADAGYPVTVTDSIGRRVVFDRPPARVVVGGSAGSYWTEILHCLELDEVIVGIDPSTSKDVYLPEKLREKTLTSSLQRKFDWEKIVALDADLIIMGEWYGSLDSEEQKTVERAASMGIPVLAVGIPDPDKTGTTMPLENIRLVRLFGEVFNQRQRAEELASFLEKCCSDLFETARRIPDDRKKSVLIAWSSSFVSGDGKGGIYISNRGACAQCLPLIGARNAATDHDFSGVWPKLDLEKMIVYFGQTVDFFVIADDTGDTASLNTAVDRVKNGRAWQAFRAARTGNVAGIAITGRQKGAANLYGPRFITGMAALGHAVYPEFFSNWEPVDEELLHRFYRLK